jgi:membrane protease YdiL (CAAX protease family)
MRNDLSALSAPNKIEVILEVIIVFLPVSLCLLINSRIGADHTVISGDTVLLQGPIAYAGLAATLFLLWIATRRRGGGWSDYGLRRPKNWLFTVLMSLGVALGILGAVVLAINPLIGALPNLEPRDMSMYHHLYRNFPNLVINIVGMWFSAAFLEEFLFRGYLLNRLMVLMGRPTGVKWGIAILASAVIFGFPHFFQGTAGIIKIGAIGIVFGVSFLIVRRNLWPLILAHGLIDTIDFVTHYFEG